MRWLLLRGTGGSCLLLVSGLCYARVPAGSSVLRLPLRERADHLTVGLWLAFIGLLLLTWAWLGLVRRVAGDPHGVRLVWLAVAAWTAPLLLAPPLFSGDGWSYVAGGYLAGHGYSPYETPPSILSPALRSGVSAMWRGTTSPYGPLPIVWGAAFSKLTADPWLLLFANRLLAFVGLGLLAVSVPALARRAGRDPARATALVVASPFVVAHGIGGLHNDLLVAAGDGRARRRHPSRALVVGCTPDRPGGGRQAAGCRYRDRGGAALPGAARLPRTPFAPRGPGRAGRAHNAPGPQRRQRPRPASSVSVPRSIGTASAFSARPAKTGRSPLSPPSSICKTSPSSTPAASA